MTDFERLGGEAALQGHVAAYVDRFFQDLIIGFFFEGKDRDRIVRFETQLAASHLGGPQSYEGRPLGATHAALRINAGHFRRRLAILRHVLAERGVPSEVIDHWITFERGLEAVVTNGRDCLE